MEAPDTERSDPGHTRRTVAILIGVAIAAALVAVYGFLAVNIATSDLALFEAAEPSSRAEEIDRNLSGMYVCVADEEADADEKTDCVAPYTRSLSILADLELREHEQGIVRRALILVTAGTTFAFIQSELYELRVELATGPPDMRP